MQWNGRLISMIVVVALTSFMGTFLISSVNIALPAIEKSFLLDAVSLSRIVTAFLLSTAIFLLPAGRWGDLMGIRRLFRIGLFIFVISSLGGGLAPSGNWLILCRFIQGIGAAFSNTTGPAILVSAFPPQHRGRVLGISVSGVYTGLAAGPFIGGMLTEYAGWRSIFFTGAALGLFCIVLAWIYLGKDETSTSARRRFDYPGTGLYMTGFVLLVAGSSMIPFLAGWLFLAFGTFALILFWFVETRTEMPVLDTRLFKGNRLFAYSNIAALINYSATFAIVFYLSLFLQKIQGMPPRTAGTILVAQPVMMALMSPITGRLSDRIQPRFFTSTGMFMCALGLLAMAFLTAATPVWAIVLLLLWVGTGFALFSSPNMNTIMGSVQKHQLGLASGTAATMRVAGQIISMTIATLFIALYIGNQTVKTVPDAIFLRTMHYGFITFALICGLGVWFSMKRGKVTFG
ncbi:MAG TPA: MFS transporter [Bacteroidales bacterium]|nr:MFS transporter [Bacteroidales bacterium]HRZ50242.1 MFS transporter [Bacteroidales bacterium]